MLYEQAVACLGGLVAVVEKVGEKGRRLSDQGGNWIWQNQGGKKAIYYKVLSLRLDY